MADVIGRLLKAFFIKDRQECAVPSPKEARLRRLQSENAKKGEKKNGKK